MFEQFLEWAEEKGWASVDWDSVAVIIWVFVLLGLVFGFGS